MMMHVDHKQAVTRGVSLGKTSLKIVSWNLLHKKGADFRDIQELIDNESPDIFLMQEARDFTKDLLSLYGGCYNRISLVGRRHGTACWSRLPFARQPLRRDIPSGLLVRRHAQILHFCGEFGEFSIANVHLSHGQILNRRQLRTISQTLGDRAIIIGDYNMVGPCLLPGFSDVGPRQNTHHMLQFLPLRLDRCLIRGLDATEPRRLGRYHSDHNPITMMLHL